MTSRQAAIESRPFDGQCVSAGSIPSLSFTAIRSFCLQQGTVQLFVSKPARAETESDPIRRRRDGIVVRMFGAGINGLLYPKRNRNRANVTTLANQICDDPMLLA